MVFPVVTYRCESWTIKKAKHQSTNTSQMCWWRRLLDSKEIKPVNPKRNQAWILIGRTDAAAEAPILWPPDVKSSLTGKDPDAGKDCRQEEKGMTEDEKVGWHHWLSGRECELTPGDSEGEGSPVCYSSWGRKESDMTEQLNNNNKTIMRCGVKAGHTQEEPLPLFGTRVDRVSGWCLWKGETDCQNQGTCGPKMGRTGPVIPTQFPVFMSNYHKARYSRRCPVRMQNKNSQ